jgi:hypothetical protein
VSETKHNCVFREDGLYVVVCSIVRPRKIRGEECAAPGRCTVEVSCSCPAKAHTFWLCARHYDYWMNLKKFAKSLLEDEG